VTALAAPPRRTAGEETGRRIAAVLLLGAAAGSAAYAAAVTVLARWPSIVRDRGAGGAARPLLVAAVAVPIAAGGVLLLVSNRGAAPRHAVATALVGVGAAWVVWGLVEQHLLRTFDVAPRAAAAATWDALFHAVGLVTAGVGTSILSARRPIPGAT
jgi:predicted membrane protein DUF2243